MIVVGGRPFDIDPLMEAYQPNSIEGELLRRMADSTGTYGYDSVSELTFELELRREIVDAARALSRSRFSFAVFHKSRCNETYWERTANGGFDLREGELPSEAVMDIYTNGGQYATECATAILIVYYRALLETFGAERFDALFPHIYLMNWSRLDPLLREAGTPRRAVDQLPGDRGYFRNPDVDPETPEWQGENVIILPNDLYYGHGIGLTRAAGIIRGLNAHRREGSTQSAYLMDEVGRPDFKRLAGLYDEGAARGGYPEWGLSHPRISVMY